MVVISLGTNLGDRLNNLRKAIDAMRCTCLRNIKTSIVIETEAILPANAPDSWNIPYLNMVVSGETDFSPMDLLCELKKIERSLGRPEVYEVWSPRIIDLDILLYDDIRLNTEKLTIPHKELNNRPFFLHLMRLMGIHCDYSFDGGEFVKSFVLNPEIIGIVNVTQDSFSDGGLYFENYVEHAQSLMANGASIIEVSAQSSNRNAVQISEEEEINRLCRVVGDIRSCKLSVDSFRPNVAAHLLDNFALYMINDVGGQYDNVTLSKIAHSGAMFCFVHSCGAPVNDAVMNEDDLVGSIYRWGQDYINRLLKIGFSKDQLVFDPGIGFGKNAYQSLRVIKNIEKFKELGCKIMLGHSRKQFISSFVGQISPIERDVETFVISQCVDGVVDYLRVHNVRDNMRALVTGAILK